MKRSLLIALFFVFVSACGGGDSSSMTIYGTTGGATASANISARSITKSPTSTLEGSPTSLKMEQYELWVSPNTDCSSPVLVKSYGNAPRVFEVAQGAVAMFSASPASGTYNCIIFKMGSVINFTPDSVAADAFSSCTEVEHSFDLFIDGDTFKDIDGNDVAGQGTKLVPVDDAMYIFASTDVSAIPSTTAHAHQTMMMNTALTVPGSSYMIMNFDNLIYEDTDSGTAVCWVEAPSMGFSSTPSVDAIKSWQGCVSSTETVTSEGTSGGNLWVTTSGVTAQYYGAGHVNVVDGSGFSSWTALSGAMTSKSAGSSAVLESSNTKYVAAYVSSPPPTGIYIQKYDGGSWSNFSNQITGFTAYNASFKRDNSYFYASYSNALSATGPVRVFRLPLDGSTSDWTAIGLDIATTTSHSYVMHPSSNNVFVTDTGSGLSVTRYSNSTGLWATLGDPLTTSAVESHDMLSVGEGMVLIAWTLPSSYAVTVASYTDATGVWQTIGDLSGIRASGVKLDYVGSTIYLLYKDVDNASAITIKTYTEGDPSHTWNALPSTITANGPTIYDFDVLGQTPYVLYSHTDNGQTPLLCKKFAVTQ